MSDQMQAVIFTAQRQAKLKEVTAPDGPLGAAQVQGTTLVSLASPGTELNWGYLGDSFPSRPGYAAVFRVDEAGEDVTDIAPGDVVFGMGPHQSLQRCPRREAVKLPDGLEPARAVFARLMGVSMTTLMTTRARPGEIVLVTGLGLVGNLAAQVFAHCGYRVIGVEPDADRRVLARSVGLGDVREAVPLDDEAVAGSVALVVECSGHEQAVLDGCRVVRRGGEVVLVGVPWQQRADVQAHELLHAVFHRYAVVRTGWEWGIPNHADQFSPHSIYGNFRTALGWLRDGSVRVDGLGERVAPADAGRVYEGLLARRGPALTAVFDWSPPS